MGIAEGFSWVSIDRSCSLLPIQIADLYYRLVTRAKLWGDYGYDKDVKPMQNYDDYGTSYRTSVTALLGLRARS